MSIGNNRAEQELTRLLAQTLVQKEVIEPMNKIGWSHVDPPAPDYSGRPAQAEGAPAPQSAQAPQATPAAPAQPDAKADAPTFSFNIEDFKNPLTGKYFDKYNSAAEAMKGLGHLANMAKNAFSERDAAVERENALRTEMTNTRPTPVASPAAAPASFPPVSASRAELDAAKRAHAAVLAEVAEDGGVFNEETARRFAETQSELSEQAARFAVVESRDKERRASEAENARWSAVSEYMTKKYPEAEQFAAETGLHVQSDPLLAEAVAALVARGKEKEASEFAWLAYKRAVQMNTSVESRAQAEEVEADLAARGQVRQDLKERALRDAGVVVGSPGGAGIHTNPNQGSSAQEIEALAAAMKRQGETPGSPAAAAWRHAVIGRFLPPDLFSR
jgi:hypothetical protein